MSINLPQILKKKKTQKTKSKNLSFSPPSKSTANWLAPRRKDKLYIWEFSSSWPHWLGKRGGKEGKVLLLGRQEEERVAKLLFHSLTNSLPAGLSNSLQFFGRRGGYNSTFRILEALRDLQGSPSWLFSAPGESPGTRRGYQRR